MVHRTIPSYEFSYFLCHPVEKVRVAFKNFINYLRLLESVNFCQGSLKDRRLTNPMETPCNRHLIDSLCQQDLSQVVAIFSQWHSVTSSEFKFNIITGPPLKSIISNSKFVSSPLLSLFRQIHSRGKAFVLDNVKCTNMDHELDELLLDVLAKVSEGSLEYHVVSSGRHQTSPHFSDVLTAISLPEKKMLSQKQVSSKATFYIRHVTSLPNTEFPTNDLHPLAMEQFFDLLEWIEFTLSKFTESDILAISVDHSLDRLTVGLMYLLCKGFSSYAILPRSYKWLHPQTVPGQIFLFRLPSSHSPRNSTVVMSLNEPLDASDRNGYSPNTQGHLTPQFHDHLHQIRSHFTNLKCTVNQHLQTQVSSCVSVMELIPVPKMLEGEYNLQLLYWQSYKVTLC